MWFALAAMLAACGRLSGSGFSPSNTPAISPTAAISPTTMLGVRLVAPRAYPDAGIRLSPPPATVYPSFSATAALHTCATHQSPCETERPSAMELALYSDDQYGIIDPRSGAVTHIYQNVLAWVMTWKGETCLSIGPAPISGARPTPNPNFKCDFMIFIDAQTGHYLLAVQTGSPSA